MAPPTVAVRALRGYTVDWPQALAVLATYNESTNAPPTLNGTIELSPPPPPLTLRNMPFLFDKKVVVPQNVMVRVIGMADALSDYSHRRHLQGHTMDGHIW